MHIDREEIEQLDRVFRLNLVNSVTGIKPGNLIGSVSQSGLENLAIISSVVHMGSNPPLIGFFVRPGEQTRRHSFMNIQETGFYSINQLPAQMTEEGHATSAKFPREESEFEHCGFTPEYLDGFSAPFVRESQIKTGMKFHQAIPISVNETTLVIGEVMHIIVEDELIHADGAIDLAEAGSAGISGVSKYYSLKAIAEYARAEVQDFPPPTKNT